MKEDNSFSTFLISITGFIFLLFLFLFYMHLDLRDKYEQRIIVTFCDNRDPVNLYFISKDVINIHTVKTSYDHHYTSGNFVHKTTYSITPTLEFFDYYRNEKLKFINVCDITEFETPKKVIEK
jgi:hypothetical protein